MREERALEASRGSVSVDFLSRRSSTRSSVRLARWKSCAEMAHPNGYSTADLDALFERPKSIQQLLQNLELASERDLLLQPQFYDELTAQKFFAGAKVTRSSPDNFGNATDVKLVLGDIGGEGALPMMTATLDSDCWLTQYKPENGPAQTTVSISGFMRIEVASNSGITLRVVRSVFGHEAENSVDRGVDPHGHVYAPTYKGGVAYPSIDREKIEGARVETDFYFQLDQPAAQGRQLSLKIADDDLVTRIDMRAIQRRIVRDQ